LAVDPAGNSYVASPYTYSNSTGNQYAMVCINTGGTQTYFYNTYASNNIAETWNLAYSCNYSTLIQAGCGMGAGNTSQVTIMTPTNGNVGQQYANTTKGEVYAGCVAPNGFYYALSADSSSGGGASSGPYNNLLCCKITGATVTLNYAQHLDYKFRDYTSKSGPSAIGTNGIAAGCGYLYTSDGYSLDQRDLLTGQLIKRVTITGGSNGSSSNGGGMGNATDGNVSSGVAVDLACGYVYAGSTGNVYIYDANLNSLGSYAVPAGGIVYDVTLNNGLVSACGATSANDGFVAQFTAKTCPSLINITHVNASCGGNNGSATANPSFCVAPYAYSWNPSGQTTQTATGLAPGLYTVSVTTQTSCASVTDTVTIFNSGNLTASVSSLPTTCGKANGSATVTVNGGSAPYTYSWSTIPFQTTSSLSNLPAGTYTVSVKDAGGCAGTATGVVKNSAGGILTITAQKNVTCYSGSDGSATANLNGGTAPLTYTWTPSGGTTPTATGLIAGVYTITVKDSSGCTASDTVVITQPPLIVLTTSTTPSGCAGPTGTASVTATGGKGNYTYSWSPSGGTAATASSLAPGTYLITVKDSSGCTQSSPVVVHSTSGIASSITASVNVLCAGGNNGSATVAVTGGHIPYTYSWLPSGGTAATATGLTAGVYTVNATDSAGCLTSSIDTVKQPSPLLITTAGINPHCFNQCTGQVSCIASGGTFPYTYSWSTGCDSVRCKNICSGTYTISLKDANGCQNSDSIKILQPPAMLLTMYTTPSSCNKSNGYDSVSVSGGTPAYLYSWSPGPGSVKPGYSNLAAGLYTVFVKDSSGCSSMDTMRVTNTGAVAVSIPVSANVTCFGGRDGYAVATTIGGTAPYTYSWSPTGGTLDTAKNLSAGLYTVTITDAKGCAAEITVAIRQPTPVTVSPMGPLTLCQGQCTALNATGAGGTPGYTYIWTLGTLSVTPPVCPLINTTYTVIATDSKGCVSPPQTVLISVQPPLEVLTGPPLVFCTGGSGPLHCTPSGGNGNYSYNWIPPTGLNNSTIQNPIASPSVTTTYTVIVSDNCGTTPDSATVLVTVNPMPVTAFTANDTAGCVPLCVTFTQAAHPGCANAIWSFGDGTTGTGCSPVNHCYRAPGNYSVGVSMTDTAGCKASASILNYIHVYPFPQADFTFSPKPADILNPQISFFDLSTGATGWSWSFGDLAGATSNLQNPQYTYPDTGCYEVILVVNNSYGCKDTAKGPVCVIPIFTFYAPNTFTPNGDGRNDVWMPQGVGIDPNHYHLLLFDRWGNLMFETSQWGQGWDGRANSGANIAQIDTYVWKVDLQDFSGKQHSYSGICNLIK
jgi:gliding motility-associated-like protein